MHTSNPRNHWTELATRQSDGLRVSLLWSRQDDRVKVEVTDARLDRTFEIRVAGADALAAFHHPFAHAPSQRTSPVEVALEAATPRQR